MKEGHGLQNGPIEALETIRLFSPKDEVRLGMNGSVSSPIQIK